MLHDVQNFYRLLSDILPFVNMPAMKSPIILKSSLHVSHLKTVVSGYDVTMNNIYELKLS